MAKDTNDVRVPGRAIEAIGTAPESFRILTAHAMKQGAEQGRVDRDAKPNGAIYGLSVITRGEALGHGTWIDDEFVDQVVAAGKAMGRVKSRFTHPDMSSDGLGKQLGRAGSFRRAGAQAYADLHFLRAASKAPQGDLADYTMALAEEAPEDFGTSIVLWRDRGAEDRFRAEHTDEEGTFTSPDPDNTKNLRHIRLATLEAVDVVDEPAANEGGLFSRSSAFAAQADQVAAFALGLTAEEPACQLFDRIHPERVKRFAQGFLARHGLKVVSSESGVPTAGFHIERTEAMKLTDLTIEQLKAERSDLVEQLRKSLLEEAAAGAESQLTTLMGKIEPAPEDLAAARDEGAKVERERFAALKQAFPGKEAFAAEQFEAGASLEQAKNAFRDVQVGELLKENAELKKRMGAAPVGFAGEPEEKPHLEKAQEYAAEHKCGITEALRATAPVRQR